MSHNLKGNEYVYASTTIDVVYNNCKYFMENVVGYPWVIEDMGDTECRFYLDESKTIGFAVYKNSGDTGIYVLKGTTKSTKIKLKAASLSSYGYYNHWLYSHVSEKEDVIYLGSYGYNNSAYYYGFVAAKDGNGKWSILYSENNTGYIADETHIDINTKLSSTNTYNYINSTYAIMKCPNVLSGTEYNELYYVASSPTKPQTSSTQGAQSLFIAAEGKTYRLVPLWLDYIALAFPVSD